MDDDLGSGYCISVCFLMIILIVLIAIVSLVV